MSQLIVFILGLNHDTTDSGSSHASHTQSKTESCVIRYGPPVIPLYERTILRLGLLFDRLRPVIAAIHHYSGTV